MLDRKRRVTHYSFECSCRSPRALSRHCALLHRFRPWFCRKKDRTMETLHAMGATHRPKEQQGKNVHFGEASGFGPVKLATIAARTPEHYRAVLHTYTPCGAPSAAIA